MSSQQHRQSRQLFVTPYNRLSRLDRLFSKSSGHNAYTQLRTADASNKLVSNLKSYTHRPDAFKVCLQYIHDSRQAQASHRGEITQKTICVTSHETKACMRSHETCLHRHYVLVSFWNDETRVRVLVDPPTPYGCLSCTFLCEGEVRRRSIRRKLPIHKLYSHVHIKCRTYVQIRSALRTKR